MHNALSHIYWTGFAVAFLTVGLRRGLKWMPNGSYYLYELILPVGVPAAVSAAAWPIEMPIRLGLLAIATRRRMT